MPLYTCPATIAAGAGVPKTLMQIVAGANQPLRLHSLLLGSTSAAALAGARVAIYRQTNAGTASSTGVAPQEVDPAGRSAEFTYSHTFTAEPTGTTDVVTWGLDVLSRDTLVLPGSIVIPASGRLGIVVVDDDSSSSVGWAGTAFVEE